MDNLDKVYLEVLNNKIKSLNGQISYYSKAIQNKKFLLAREEKKLIALKNELKKIELEKEEYERTNVNKYSDSKPIKALDSYYEKKENKIETVNHQIEYLKGLKERLKTESVKKQVDRKIEKKEEILKKLKKREVRISRVQKSTIMSKRIISSLKRRAFSRQEASKEYYANKLEDNTSMKNSLDTEAKGFEGKKNRALKMMYNIKEKHYMRKSAKHTAILKEMKEKNVGIVRGRAIVMTKKATNSLRRTRDLVNRAIESSLDDFGTRLRV